MTALLGASLGTYGADVFVPGAFKFESWVQVDGNPADLGGANLDDALLLPQIPSFGPPTDTLYMSALNTRTVYPNDNHENYIAIMTGVWIAPETGQYHVFLRSDDDGRLYLNKTGATPPNIFSGTVVPLVKEDLDCCDGFISPGVDDDGDGFGDGDAEATTVTPISVTAGTQYGLTIVLKEGGGGDWLEVDFRKVGDTRANRPTPGSEIGSLAPEVAITTQPANWSTSENFPTTVSVGVNTPAGVTYQWLRAGAEIPGATGASYTFSPVAADNGVKYSVKVTQGSKVITSSEATLTVSNDTTAPTIASAGTFLDRNGVLVTFSEPMGPGLNTAANYAISGGVSISGLTPLNDYSVFLATSVMNANAALTLTVSNVRDKASGGGNLVSPNTKAFTVSGPPPAGTPRNLVHYRRYEGSPDIADLRVKLEDGTTPDAEELLPSYEAPVNIAENHSTQLEGYFIPPVTGSYVFYVHSDDPGEAWLSTDSNPANKKLIAREPTWNDNRDWVTLDRRNGAAPENRSNTYEGSEWPGGGNNIFLVAGQKYYAEVVFHEGGGGDNGGLNFSVVGDANYPVPADGDPTRMIGERVVWYSALAEPLSVTMGPSVTVALGGTVTLSPAVTGPGPITYQWYKSKRPITGATSKTYTITNAKWTDAGDYSLEVTNNDGTKRGNPGAADDTSRVYIANPTFIIEAEDYNYGGGQFKPEASSASYRGGAYGGLKATIDIDGFHDGDNSGGAAFSYQRASPTDEMVIEDKGIGDGVNSPVGRDRGSFSMDVNYALGWTAATEWQNYTRVYPKGTYGFVLAGSHDGLADDEVNMIWSKVANPKIADGSSVGAEGGAQGLTKVGQWLSPGTGAWSSNDLIPLADDNLNPVTVQLEGEVTFRLTFNAQDGDADWIGVYCLDCAAPATAKINGITLSGNNVTVSFEGVLQSSDTVNGTYSNVAGASGTSWTGPASGTQKYYRAASQ